MSYELFDTKIASKEDRVRSGLLFSSEKLVDSCIHCYDYKRGVGAHGACGVRHLHGDVYNNR